VHGLSCDTSDHKGLTPLVMSVVLERVSLRGTSQSKGDEGRVSKGFRDDPKGDEVEREKKSTQERFEEQQHLDWKIKSGLRPLSTIQASLYTTEAAT